MAKTNHKQYRQAQLRALEWEVKLYHETKAALNEEKDEILLAGVSFDEGMPRGSGIGNKTANKAMKLYNSATIRNMERRVWAIERAMAEWCAVDTKVRMEFIRLKFWDNRLTDAGIALKLNSGERTIKRWKPQFLSVVGNYLGWRV